MIPLVPLGSRSGWHRAASGFAVIGHDYGAMYGSLLADSDHHVSVLVFEAARLNVGQLVRHVLARSRRALVSGRHIA
jgi:hypothetical protein